ncbi:MAG TPA: hypothetical protein VFF73_15335, partial [Planctomycetota bacterium]|nr:hypothetical protein [Planctomycetota bacterium]
MGGEIDHARSELVRSKVEVVRILAEVVRSAWRGRALGEHVDRSREEHDHVKMKSFARGGSLIAAAG